jgi:hypothetical protein
MNTMNTENLRLLNVLVAKEAKGELTERQVEKLDALRVELRPVLVKEAIAAALQYEKTAAPRRSARLAAKPPVSYEGLDVDADADADEEVAEEGPRRSSRLAAKPRVSYAGMDGAAESSAPTVGQLRASAAVAGLLTLRNAGV